MTQLTQVDPSVVELRRTQTLLEGVFEVINAGTYPGSLSPQVAQALNVVAALWEQNAKYLAAKEKDLAVETSPASVPVESSAGKLQVPGFSRYSGVDRYEDPPSVVGEAVGTGPAGAARCAV